MTAFVVGVIAGGLIVHAFHYRNCFYENAKRIEHGDNSILLFPDWLGRVRPISFDLDLARARELEEVEIIRKLGQPTTTGSDQHARASGPNIGTRPNGRNG